MSGRVFDDFDGELDMFLRSSLFDDFTLFCWIEVDVMNWMCMFLHDSSLKTPSICAELPT